MGHTGGARCGCVGRAQNDGFVPWWAVFVNPNHTLSQGNGPQNDIFFYIFAEGFKNKHTESILLVMLTIILQILTSTGPLARCDKSSVSQEVARNASPGTRRRFGWPALNSLGFHVFQSVVTIMWFSHVFSNHICHTWIFQAYKISAFSPKKTHQKAEILHI